MRKIKTDRTGTVQDTDFNEESGKEQFVTMKKQYQKPSVQISRFLSEDILAASNINQPLYSAQEQEEYHIDQFAFEEIRWN